MQPQPEFNSYYNNNSSNSKSKTATTKTTNNNSKNKQQESEEAAIAPKIQKQQQQQEQEQQPTEKQSSRILRTTTTATEGAKQQQQQLPRVIKSKQPLLNFRFYLDIRDHQVSRYIEKQIKLLGGVQEFFLDANVTHFVTDKEQLQINNKSGQQSIAPTTSTKTANILELKNAAAIRNSSRVAQTRANAILSRVRVQNNNTTTRTNHISEKITATTTTYTVWQSEYAIRFFKKVQHELKAYLQAAENSITSSHTAGSTTATTGAGSGADIITLKGGYIKFEAIKRNCRPYYHSFRAPYFDWPKVSLKSEEGAFCLTAEKPQPQPPPPPPPPTQSLEMTRKSRSRSSQCATPLEVTMPPLRKTTSTVVVNNNKTQCRQIKESTDKQCGVCEICKVEYDALTIHLKTKDHEYFARNTQNFIALDTLIQSSADVNKFLAAQVESNEEGMELCDPLEQPLAINNLSPPLRERSKRSTKGKHSSEKFQNKRSKTTKNAPKTLQITPTKSKRKKCNNGNSSSPIRPFPPPSSLYKVVETTSQVESATPKRLTNDDTVTASPSLIVKIKKVRTSALLRLNGEAESFMFPKTSRRASSDLPTDVDRQSSSERIRNSIYSSSSLDSSSNSDIVVNLESPTNTTLTTGTTRSVKAKRTAQCFQSTPIQPNAQLKRLRKSNTTNTTPPTNLADLSPPSAAAAIVAATAKITLPAATRKSSRMATAIVSAATTSSRLLRAAAEVVKKSGNTSGVKATRKSQKRSCRLTGVKMEDRMGDSDETNTEQELNGITKVRCNRSTTNKLLNLKPETATMPTVKVLELANDDELEHENDLDDVEEDDDKADKDFKYKYKKTSLKPRTRRGKREKVPVKSQTKKVNNSNNKKLNTSNKTTLHYDFRQSELIKDQNYAFEREPKSDLWYRVFKRQDNCEETYFQYFSNNKYHKLPYEMGPIPYTHTKLSVSCCKLCEPLKQEKELEPLIKTEPTVEAVDNATPYALKHKKLHLLQRYRQEQEALLKEQEQQEKQQHCLIKAETLASEAQSDLERLERAGSIQSTSSSCASTSKKAAFRNKLLQKAALLSLELPPRKSPREHASTLALVSIIKQRQESKPNSDTEEAAVTKQETEKATPIEEMCFATEISENVKRMRRGRNKYDHSPAYVLNKPKRLMIKKLNKPEVKKEKRLPKTRRNYDIATVKYMNMLHSRNLSLPASVRKTGQKKGVLEFAVEDSALKALDAELQPTVSVRKLELDIDNFLQSTGKELDINELSCEPQACMIDTPPATDYFSSDFDLCDLVQHANNSILVGEEAQQRSRESKHLSVYNTMALQKYFRKRKYMKTNRTGWPKLVKKKYSMRNQTLIMNEFHKQNGSVAKEVITPPASELDTLPIKEEMEETSNAVEEPTENGEEPEEVFYDVAEEEDEEGYTVMDCLVDEEVQEYEKAVEADDEDEFIEQHDKDTIDQIVLEEVEQEEEEDQEQDEEEEEEEEEDEEPKAKRNRRNSSLGKALANCLNNNDKEKHVDEQDMGMLSLIATTSTPNRKTARSSRRTPQLNGSLVSCHSPSERAGDNSDIFTVSSDGLDTDLDLSNPHPHVHAKEEQSRKNITKYDITKYVKNPAANTCAAEAATAAVKSLAIAQFLKKEVRVTCRRIRAPFRRFRYRR